MAQKTDLLSILTAYATKYNSPTIDIDSFLTFLEKYAVQQAPEHPEWQKWTKEIPVKFWGELSPLIEGQKCEVQHTAEGQGGKVYLAFWYADKIDRAYRSTDDSMGLPFPDERALKLALPPEYVRNFNVGTDPVSSLEEQEEDSAGVIRLVFPEEFGTALVLASMVPRRLLELSLLKVRSYLRRRGGRDYAMHKLPAQVTERGIHLRDILNQIQTRPLDCMRGMEDAEDFPNLFWACFCSLIKNDVRREKEREKEDVAAIQAAFVIEIFNGHYKAGVMKERERMLAFKSLETQLEKPPYLYTLDAIIRFTSTKGVLLLGQYTQGELEAYLKRKTIESANNGLPELLIITGGNDERWFIKKKNVFPLIARLLIEAKVLVKKAMERRWQRILTAYHKEPAMESDRDFEKLLANYTVDLCGTFSNLMNDSKLPVLFQEMTAAGASPKEMSNLFIEGVRISYMDLYGLKRRSVLSDVKILLPFWYSIPALFAIVSFFAGIGKQKKKIPKRGAAVEDAGEAVEKNSGNDLQQAGREIEAVLVPEDYTLKDYLEELEDRWSRLLDKEARDKLVADVRTLVRDHFRYSLRNQKNTRFSREVVNQMAVNIISSNGTLKKLGDQKSLHTYIVTYLTQLLLVEKS